MARETVQRVTDDLDGSTDAATIRFALDGYHYEIDLGPRNEARLRDALEPFLARATKVRVGHKPTRRGPRAQASPEGDTQHAQRVRQWALDNGVQLATRGRLAVSVLDAYTQNSIPALYEAAGLDYEPPAEAKPARSRRKAANPTFSEG